MSLVVGRTIRVSEDGYKFGTGTLTLHISEVLGRSEIDGAVWVELKGREVRPDGSVAVRERYALVRIDRVREVRRGSHR